MQSRLSPASSGAVADAGKALLEHFKQPTPPGVTLLFVHLPTRKHHLPAPGGDPEGLDPGKEIPIQASCLLPRAGPGLTR